MYGCQEADNDPTGTVETKQMLTYYELDLGLNHVVRKYAEGLEDRANFLINGISYHLTLVAFLVLLLLFCGPVLLPLYS